MNLKLKHFQRTYHEILEFAMSIQRNHAERYLVKKFVIWNGIYEFKYHITTV